MKREKESGASRFCARARRVVALNLLSIFHSISLPSIQKETRLKMIYTCNELNAGYAADGYARARGVACVIATFTVGGLSLLNAIAGAYSERLPVIVITGAPNSNDFGTMRVLHHTTGRPGGGVHVQSG